METSIRETCFWRHRRVSALLDWSHVQVGTRAAELAYFRIEFAVLAGWPVAEMLRDRYQEHAEVSPEHQMLRDLLHVYACHSEAHAWLEGWHAQERADLTLTDVRTRLTEIARTLLAG